jgi:lipopolysaccharide/colanic/teichoic acid biosynthesis glycosyltransferase
MPRGPSRLTLALKRLLDLTGAVLALAILSPLLLALSVLVPLKVGSPVFFRQVRAGKDGRPFRLWKFRTMTNARDASGQLLPDRVRLTKLGTFLRIYSLDELPNLFNVLVRNMSLVGPPSVADALRPSLQRAATAPPARQAGADWPGAAERSQWAGLGRAPRA